MIFYLIILVLFLILLTYIFDKKQDKFYPLSPYATGIYPIWNEPTRSTRNMSYDLRGDVPIPETGFWSPWNMSTIRPIQNTPLFI